MYVVYLHLLYTFYFDSGGADCTRNGKVISLLTHLKH